MSYTDVFGGELLFPSITSYNSITSAVDMVLQWAREQQIAGVDVVADWMDIDATAGSLNADMPSASSVSTGNKVTFNNIGSNTYTVRDATGGTIQSIAPGEQWVLILTDNSTEAGSWITSQLGATVSVASAGALAGAGIKAITTTLNQRIDSDIEAATPFTVVEGDRAKCLIYTAGAGTCNLPSPGAVANDWFFMLRNSGSGTLNVVPPSGNIDGGASINLDPNDSAFIFTDGTNFFTVGLSSGSTIAFDFVSIAIPGSGDFVLSGANLDRIAYRFTGALTGNRKIVVPTTTQQYWIDNQTSGAFPLSIATAAQGTPPQVTQGNSIIMYCDATDVVNAVSSSAIAFPITIGQGGTGAVNIAGAQGNLQVPPVGRLINTTAPLSGGGDLSADRTIVVAASTEGAVGVAELATQAEADAGTDDTRIITPLKLAGAVNVLVTANNDLKRKQVGTARSSTTTRTDDPHLAGWSLEANQNYLIEGYLLVSGAVGGITPGLSLGWNYSGSFLSLSSIGYISQTNAAVVKMTNVATGAASFDIPSFSAPLYIKGIFRTSSLGTLSLEWAQANNSANAVTLAGGSWLNVINTGLGGAGIDSLFLS